MRDRRLRRSQTISPFGVGAILDIGGESFVAEDIRKWKGRANILNAPTIARLVGVNQLRTAPEAPDTRGPNLNASGVQFCRFPLWLFCTNEECRNLLHWDLMKERNLEAGSPPRCPSCAQKPQLTPMRFVMVCGNGHLGDVDWFKWAHSATGDRAQRTCAKREKLAYRVSPDRGVGLGSIYVECTGCGATRDLEGIAAPHTPRSLGWSCQGRQPWFAPGIRENCDQAPAIIQRGASNVYFPAITSAIEIPPDADYEHFAGPPVRIRANQNFGLLETNPQHPFRDQLIPLIALEEEVTEDLVRHVLGIQLGADAPAHPNGAADLSVEQITRDEWRALTIERDHEAHPKDRFVVEHTDLSNRHRPAANTEAAELLTGRLAHLVKVRRLREVRVLRGFHRYTMENMVPADVDQSLDWLPAIEVYGEGILLALDEQSVSTWETLPNVRDRIQDLEDRREASVFSKFLPVLTPRFVMLHTLAHLLIRQLIYESGYSSSSIRERLYVAESSSPQPMAGLMVYTGAGDSEGTLGGLVRSGDPDWFLPTLITALQRGDWCSLDPVCAESSSQGPDGLSLAACHACALVAETSCDYGNLSLDRKILIDPQLGYLHPVLVAAEQARLGIL